MKRILSFVLCLIMVFMLVPVSALAEEGGGQDEVQACAEGCTLEPGHGGDCALPAPAPEPEEPEQESEPEPEPEPIPVTGINVRTRDTEALTTLMSARATRRRSRP